MLAQPLSRLEREQRLALVGLRSWGEPTPLLGLDTRTLWDCLLLELLGWKELCLAASLYSGSGSLWTVLEPPEPPYPLELPLVWLLSSL